MFVAVAFFVDRLVRWRLLLTGLTDIHRRGGLPAT